MKPSPETVNQAKALAARYIKVVYWSEGDQCYIGSLPEICGPCCDAADEQATLTLLNEIVFELALDKIEGGDMGTIPAPQH